MAASHVDSTIPSVGKEALGVDSEGTSREKGIKDIKTSQMKTVRKRK
jgi:hypothetical protein